MFNSCLNAHWARAHLRDQCALMLTSDCWPMPLKHDAVFKSYTFSMYQNYIKLKQQMLPLIREYSALNTPNHTKDPRESFTHFSTFQNENISEWAHFRMGIDVCGKIIIMPF